MKILFVEPNIEGRIGEPPLNIAGLKSFINQMTDHTAKCCDLSFQKRNWKDHLLGQIDEGGYEVVGISTMSFNFYQTVQIADFLKSQRDIPILVGGVHCILQPDEVIACPSIDLVCTAEGEWILKDLLDANLNPEGIGGIWYKDTQGQVVQQANPEVEANIDQFPFPDWDDFPIEKYFMFNMNSIPIMGSRGCPYTCTYCSAHAIAGALGAKKTRYRSADNLIGEIEYLYDRYGKSGLRHIFFEDDVFIGQKKRVYEFCEKYVERGFHKKYLWTAKVRANIVNEDILLAMKQAGCYEAGMGVESSNDYVRNKIFRRNMSTKQILDAAALIKGAGLMLHVPIIMGSPFDTKEIMEENLKFMKKLEAECMLFPILMPLPGTDIRELCEEEGVLEGNEGKFDHGHVMYTKPVIKTKYLTKKEVKSFIRKIRWFLVRHYTAEGFRLKGLTFAWDVLYFLTYLMPKYKLEVDNLFRYTVNRYHIQNVHKDRNILVPGYGLKKSAPVLKDRRVLEGQELESELSVVPSLLIKHRERTEEVPAKVA